MEETPEGKPLDMKGLEREMPTCDQHVSSSRIAYSSLVDTLEIH